MIKNVMKRWLSLFLALAMVFCALPELSFVAEAAEIKNIVEGVDAGGDASKITGGMTVEATSTAYTKGSCGTTNAAAKTSKATLTSTLNVEAKLTFDYTIDIQKADGYVKINGEAQTANGHFEQTVAGGGEINFEVFSGAPETTETTTYTSKIEITNISLAVDKLVTTTFLPAEGGSYTVDGAAVTAEYQHIKNAKETTTLVAAPAEGYIFLGWYSRKAEKFVSLDTEWTTHLTEDQTIEARFAPAAAPVFQVGTDFRSPDLNAAANFAATKGPKTVVLVRDGTLPAGEYTIPSGVTLLIPFDEAGTTYTTTPGNTKNVWAKPYVYRKLTMASGAALTVSNGGAISISAKFATLGGNQNPNGATTGPYGQIQMDDGSSITLENGGALYAWGYVTGSGEITAKSGSKAYEYFQISDFRGGSVTLALYNGRNEYKVFPFSQYYIQNIEAPITFESGANEYGYTGLYASSSVTATTIPFIGATGSLFNLTSGTLTKRYDPTADRLMVTVNGDMEVDQITVTAMGKQVKSSEFVLPVNGNISLEVTGGTTTISKDTSLLPGVKIAVDSGATFAVREGIKLYVYDSEEWIAGNYTNTKQLIAAVYSPTAGRKTRTASDLTDVDIQVDGTLQIDGALYTTAAGANINTVTGDGKVVFASAPVSAKLYEIHNNKVQGSSFSAKIDPEAMIDIPITSAQLKNADGMDPAYTQTADAAAGTTFVYANGKWIVPMTKDAWNGFTVSDPAPVSYDGESKTYDMTGVENADQITVTYEKDGQPVEEPRDAGEYTATFSCGTYEAKTATLTIAPKELTVNWTDPESLTYDGQQKTVTAAIEESGVVTDDDVKLTLSGDTSATNAGAYTATAKLEGEKAGNYVLAGAVDGTVSHEWTVAKANAPGITFPTVEAVTYDPDGKLSSVTLNGGSTEYGTFAWTNQDVKPTVENAGYEVIFTPSESAANNYGLTTQTKTVSLTVDPKELTVTWTDPMDLIYDGRDKTVTAALDPKETGSDRVSLALTGATEKNAGDYTATASLTGDDAGNYTLKDAADGKVSREWTIAKKPVTFLWPDENSYTYNGKEQKVEPAIEGVAEADKEAVSVAITSGSATDAGDYTATAGELQGTASENYEIDGKAIKTFRWSITKKPVTVSWTVPEDPVYNGTKKTVTATATGLVEGDGVTLTLSDNTATNEGIYTAQAALSGEKAANYELTGSTTRTFTITKKEVGIEWGEDTFIYDGGEKSLTATATGVVEGDTVTLILEGNGRTVVGNQTVTVTGLSSTNYKLPDDGRTHTLTVNAAEFKNVTVTATETLDGAGNTTLTVSGVPEGASVKVTLDGKEITGTNGSYTAALENPETNTGETHTFKVTVTGDNYNKFEKTYTVTVNHKHAEVTDKAKEPTCTETGLTEGKHCSVCNEVLVKQETVAAKGHGWGDWTDSKDGNHHTRTCQNDSAHVETAAHTWNDGKVTTEPTCTGKGVRTYACTVCGAAKTEEIKALGHEHIVFTGWDEDSWKNTDGKWTVDVTLKCVRCDSAKTETVEAPKNEEESKAATCLEDGQDVFTAVYGESSVNHVVNHVVVIEKLGHNTDGVVAHRDATCTEDGVVGGTYCTRCNEGREAAEAIIPKLGHNTDGVVEHKDATCTADGVVGGTYCTRCNEGKEAAEAKIDKLGHDYVKFVGWEAWQESGGGYAISAKLQCVRCDSTISDAATVSEPVTVSPSCTVDGSRTWNASINVNGTEYTAEPKVVKLSAPGHTMTKTEAKAATCTETGNYEYYTCSVCGKVYKDAKGVTETTAEKEIIKALGHDITKTKAKEVTCTDAGNNEYYTCSVCHKVYKDAEGVIETTAEKEIIKALGHDMKDVENTARAATCTEAGKEADQKCTRCDHTETGAEIKALGHDFAAEFTVDKEATCTEKGSKSRHCARCDATTDVTEISTVDHSLTHHDAVAATCVATGTIAYDHCSVCGKNFVNGEEAANLTVAISPNNHVGETEVRDAKEAACTEEGYTGDTYCKSCNKVIEQGTTIGKKAHTPGTAREEDRVEAKCEETGSYNLVVRCTVCNAVVSSKAKTITALGHDMKDVENTARAATCTEAGKEADQKCTRCDHTETGVEIKALDHNTEGHVDHKDATCTEDGVAGGTYCTRCNEGKEAAEAVIEKLGHNEEGHVDHKDATCTEDGVVGGTYCTRCNEGKEAAEAVIPAKGHTSGAAVREKETPATCTEGGSYEEAVYCSECKAEISCLTKTVEPLGHSYGEPEWIWTESEDGGFTAKAIFSCIRGDDSIEAKATVEKSVVEATCTGTGLETYIASVEFENHAYEAEKEVQIPANGHVYGEPEWLWEKQEDGSYIAVASFVCIACSDELELEAEEVTRNEVPATCEEEGHISYTAKVKLGEDVLENVLENETVIPAIGHKYGEPSGWTWSEDHTTATAAFVCENDNSHVETVNAIVTSEETPAQPGIEGVRTYTATVTFNSETYDDTRTETIPALPNGGGEEIDDPNVPLADPLPYDDVTEADANKGIKGDWFAADVRYMYENEIMTGTSTNTFSPYMNITRGQIVTTLYRLAGSPEVTATKSQFTDVPSNQYYFKAIVWATENGIAKGYSETSFKPGKVVNREEMTAFMYRYAEYKKYDLKTGDISEFTDAGKVTAYAVPYMQWATAAGLINGRTETTLVPQGTTTRCEAATILTRFCKEYNVIPETLAE